MRRLAAIAVASLLALMPLPVHAYSAWGSAEYGDPAGWCTNFSDMWVAQVVTNDPHVGTNPERDTFYGFHAHPGYDDWFGWFYGDFRGRPGDSSGWVKLLHENFPRHYHWNFADYGWAVHGHAKEYIAYYNWTFGGQCGIGLYGSAYPPPYMADMYGYPVVDIYVDAVPPYPPRPYVMSVTSTAVAFSWDPVADRGDGEGRDFFMAGLDHYTSWLTVSDRAGQLDFASTARPRVMTLTGLRPDETACVHVVAVDRVQNATPEQVACAAPLVPPPMPAWTASPAHVEANPDAPGLVGLDTWLWLWPPPRSLTAAETVRGVSYVLTARPADVDWDFGDGATERLAITSTAHHVYEAHSQAGYAIEARVRYDVTWSATVAGQSFGPYPLGTTAIEARPLIYPVRQAQPELVLI